MNGMTPELYRENMIELMVLQALLGVLSTNMKALTLEFIGNDVVAHFLLREESALDREEIEENFPVEVSVFTNGTEIGRFWRSRLSSWLESTTPATYRQDGESSYFETDKTCP